jgi:hypothetical protein
MHKRRTEDPASRTTPYLPVKHAVLASRAHGRRGVRDMGLRECLHFPMGNQGQKAFVEQSAYKNSGEDLLQRVFGNSARAAQPGVKQRV